MLGDLVHGSAALDAPLIARVSASRQRHAKIAMTLVASNGDLHDHARGLGFEFIGDELALTLFLLRQAPGSVA
ncbi:MAG: hypothetical protein ABI767_16910 [Rhodanobacter sp.]